MNNQYQWKLLPLALLLVLSLANIKVSAQCPTASFSLPASVCAGSPIPFTNSSLNASSYFWDFTPGHFSAAGSKISDTLLPTQWSRDITVVEQNDTGIAYFASGSSSNLFRAIYANGFDQPVSYIQDLGDLGVLYQPTDVDFYQENNEWYGLMVDYGNYSLVRFHLGSSLLNTPDGITVLHTNLTSNLTNPWSVKIEKDSSGNIFALATNFTAASYTLFDFGTSILNIPTPSTPVMIPGLLSRVMDGLIAKECGNYYAFFAGFNSGSVIRADFGTSLSNVPIFTTLISDGTPSDFALVKDSASWKLVYTNWSSSDIRKYDLGNSLGNNSPTPLGTENYGGTNLKGIEIIRKGNSEIVLIQNSGSFNIQAIKYENNTDVSSAISTDNTPSNISFNSAEIHPISLTVYDQFGNSSTQVQQIQVINSPISNFTISNLCFGDSTYFTDSTIIASGNVTSWSWDFGDGIIDTQINAVHQYTSVGQFTVTLTTGSGLCYNTRSKTITISPKPTANFMAATGCSNTPLSFVDQSTIASGTLTQWVWNFGTGDTSILQNPNYTYSTGGNYLTSLIVISDANCSASYSSNQVILSSPIAIFLPLNTCLGQATNFSNLTNANGSSITNYNWDFGDGNSDTSASPTHNFANSISNYQVILTVTAANGCNDTLVKDIRISNIPTAGFSVPTPLCQSNNVQFTDLSSVVGDTLNFWHWDFGDGTTDTISAPNHIFTQPGNYMVTLIAYSPSSCASSPSQQTVSIIQSPIAAFSNTTTCLGLSTSFTNLSTPAPGSSIASYMWHFTANDSSSFATTFFTFNSQLNYPVTLLVTSPEGCTSQVQQTVQVHPQPNANFSTILPCSKQAVQFTNQSTTDSLSSITQYSWNFGDFSNPGTNLSALQNPSHTYDTSANFTASLIVITNFGCSDTIIKNIRVNPSAPVQFTYSPTCFGDLMTFFNPGSTLDSTYLWNFGDGQTNILKEPAHYYSSARNYQVTLNVTTSKGCVSTASKQVSVSPIPVPAFSTPAGCKQADYTFIDNSTVSTGTISSYKWKITEGNINLTGQTASNVFSDTGTYHVTLTVKSDIGCSKSLMHPFTIHGLPTANFSFNPQYGNPPLEVNFIDQSIGASSYAWNFGVDTSMNFSQNPTYSYNDTGLFQINHIVTSQFGCKDSIKKSIYVNQPILDIAITGDSSYISGDYFYIVTRLTNLGTLEINNVMLEARLGDGNSIREQMVRTISSGIAGNQTYKFSAAFHLSEGINTDYYCVKAIDPNNLPDNNLSNNEKCFSKKSDISVINPYPNPVTDEFNFRIVTPYTSQVLITLYDQIGRKLKTINDGQVLKGYFDYNVDVKDLLDGIYNLQIIFNEKIYYRQIIVAHTIK